jgi:hypothetical protein
MVEGAIYAGGFGAWERGLDARGNTACGKVGAGSEAGFLRRSGDMMAQRLSACQGCTQLDVFLSGQVGEMPCLVCDRLWSEVTLGRRHEGVSEVEYARPFLGERSALRVDSGQRAAGYGGA